MGMEGLNPILDTVMVTMVVEVVGRDPRQAVLILMLREYSFPFDRSLHYFIPEFRSNGVES